MGLLTSLEAATQVSNTHGGGGGRVHLWDGKVKSVPSPICMHHITYWEYGTGVDVHCTIESNIGEATLHQAAGKGRGESGKSRQVETESTSRHQGRL